VGYDGRPRQLLEAGKAADMVGMVMRDNNSLYACRRETEAVYPPENLVLFAPESCIHQYQVISARYQIYVGAQVGLVPPPAELEYAGYYFSHCPVILHHLADDLDGPWGVCYV